MMTSIWSLRLTSEMSKMSFFDYLSTFFGTIVTSCCLATLKGPSFRPRSQFAKRLLVRKLARMMLVSVVMTIVNRVINLMMNVAQLKWAQDQRPCHLM